MREEPRILVELLHESTGKKRFAFTADHRRRLAIKGKYLQPRGPSFTSELSGASAAQREW